MSAAIGNLSANINHKNPHVTRGRCYPVAPLMSRGATRIAGAVNVTVAAALGSTFTLTSTTGANVNLALERGPRFTLSAGPGDTQRTLPAPLEAEP
jgi:hypothetical protein